NETMDALENAAVETLLLSEKLNKAIVTRKCSGCGKVERFYVPLDDADRKLETLSSGVCPECNTGYVSAKLEKMDFIDFAGDIAKQMGTEVKIVSVDTEEGKMFLDTFGGIGGFLRYKYFD
ncbi:MAG: peptide chain release factor aRF-1, partial [Promethearchaeota archaeon]